MSPTPELTAQRIDLMRQKLEETLHPETLEIEDESHHHVGHAGARDGRGHFRLHIVSPDFAGMSPLQRHRAVYAALGGLMQSDIHALVIEAHLP